MNYSLIKIIFLYSAHWIKGEIDINFNDSSAQTFVPLLGTRYRAKALKPLKSGNETIDYISNLRWEYSGKNCKILKKIYYHAYEKGSYEGIAYIIDGYNEHSYSDEKVKLK